MHIGIDASRAVSGQRTGTEHYSARLIEALGLIEGAARHRFVLYANAPRDSSAEAMLGFNLPPNFAWRPIPWRRLWTHMRLSVAMLRYTPDVLFVPSHVVPLRHPPATVVTIHDVGYLYYPDAHTAASRRYLDWSTRFSTQAARRVIAISQQTADDLVQHYAVPADKIRVIHHGSDPTFHPITDRQELANMRHRYELPLARPYILYVGTLQPRKNLARLIEAFAAGLAGERFGPQPPMLVLAGKKGWLYDELFALVERLGLGTAVHFPGYVRQEDLPTLISGAEVFALPSLYEGFGLPALEAMACGTPLIAARASSLPEVVDDAGLLCDPLDPAAWTEALAALLNDQSLRTRYSGAGMARAAQFTWARAARATLEVLEEVGPQLYHDRRG